MPLETAITNQIKKYLEAAPGCVVRKRHGTAWGVAGDPDLYGALNGRHFELEVKREGNPPTALQVKRGAEWVAAGAIYGVVHSLAEARGVLGI